MVNSDRFEIANEKLWSVFHNKLLLKKQGAFIAGDGKYFPFLFILLLFISFIVFVPNYYHHYYLNWYFNSSFQEGETAAARSEYVYWVQAFYALLSVLMTGVIGYVANKINNRRKIEGAMHERVLFEKFTSDRIFYAKKAINNQDFIEYMTVSLPKKIAEWEEFGISDRFFWQEKLDLVKSEMDKNLENVKCGFVPGNVNTDYLEYMLNEYISISKLIIDEVVDIRKTTYLGAKNFIKVYDLFESFILLRRKLSGGYAKEYQVVVVVLSK